MRPHILRLKQNQEEQIVTTATRSLDKSLAFAHGNFRNTKRTGTELQVHMLSSEKRV